MDYSKLSNETLQTLKSGKPVDYSKLSNEELLELNKVKKAPETSIPKMSEPEEETGKLESLLRGMEQGATFGFGDEINAGLESAFTNKSYLDAREESRAAFDKAQADNPYTSLAGNLAGGLAVPLPGATEASVGRMALLGAGGGALAGLGTSEADLTKGEIGKAAGDVLEGGAIGGTIGAGLGAIGKGLKAAKNKWMDTELSKDLGDMFKFSRADKEFNTAHNLEETSKGLADSIHDDYLPSIFKLDDGPSIQKSVNEQYQAAKTAAAEQGQSLDFKTFRDGINKQFDAIKIKDSNVQRAQKETNELLDAIGQVERKEQVVATPDVEQADQAMNALQSTVGKAKVTSDEAIRKLAKEYLEPIAKNLKAKSPNEEIDLKDLEDQIFTKLKDQYTQNFNPKYGVDIDPTTGKKFAKVEYDTPAGVTKVKAQELGLEPRTETVETIGRPSLTPDVLDSVSKKGQDMFDLYNLGNDTTRKNSDLAAIGMSMKNQAKPESMDPVLGDIADFMRNKFGDIKANLGLNFKGMQGDELKKAQLDAADKIKSMLVASMKNPGAAGEIRFNEANEIAKHLADSGYIDGSKITSTAEKIKVMAKKEYLMRTARGESFMASNAKNHLLLPFTAKGKSLQLASLAGKAANAADTSGVTNLASKTMRFVTADVDVIGNLAMKLEKSNNTFAPVLKSLASQPEQKRRAMMFALMQQPAFRQAINVDEDNE